MQGTLGEPVRVDCIVLLLLLRLLHMLIFGWGTRDTLMNSSPFDCPVCKAATQQKHFRRRRWMTFFFIPVVPISSSSDFLRCQACQTIIPIAACLGESTPPARLSRQALFGMICGCFALFTFCVSSISLPNAICAIALGHAALRDIKKNRSQVDGRSLAIAALAFGYPALILSSMVGLNSLFGPKRFASDSSAYTSIEATRSADGEEGAFDVSDSSNEAFKSAEYQIASKRDKPPGRGNSPQAIRLANMLAERMKEMSDEMFTSGRKPILQLSDGEYLTFCELHPDRALFLVHVPSYRKFTKDAKKLLAEMAWLAAQSTTAGQLPSDAKLAVGLRGVVTYGDILVGSVPASTEDSVTPFRAGKKEDLVAFFSAPNMKNPPPANNAPASSRADVDAGRLTQNHMEFSKANSRKTDASSKLPAPSTPKPSPDRPSIDPFTPPPTAPSDSSSPRDVANENPIATTAPTRSRQPPKPEFVNKISIERIASIENASWGTTSIALNPNGRWLATGKSDDKLALFDVATSQPIGEPYSLARSGQVTALTFSATGNHLIAGGYSGKTFVWQVTPEGRLANEQELFRFDGEITSLATSPKFDFYIGASRKGTVAWQPFGESKTQPRLMQQFQNELHDVWLPASGNEAMATDGERLVRFSLRDGQATDSIALGIKSARHANFSLSGKRLVVADTNALHFFDLERIASRRTIKLPRGEMAFGLKFHPKENWVAVGTRGKVALFDFEQAELIAYADAESVFYQTNIEFSSDGKLLAATSDSARDSIQLFRLNLSTP